jgi:hypothetical protein
MEAAEKVVGGEQDTPDRDEAVLDSVAIQRLVAEVRSEEPVVLSGYNRTYNRHNR